MPKRLLKDADGIPLEVGDKVVFTGDDATNPAHIHTVTKLGIFMVDMDKGNLFEYAHNVRKVTYG